MTLVVAKVLGACTVQDFGRTGRMHEGLPHGGALVRTLLARANRAVANPDDAAGIEVLGRVVVRAIAPVELATSYAPRRTLAAGEELVIESEPRRVAYLALRGGVAAPVRLGSRSTHASAGLGAPLRAGNELSAGDAVASPPGVELRDVDARDPIRIVAGPDGDAFAADALATLAASTYRILPTSDRVGTRLGGPRLARTDLAERSRPMVRGAIEVPRDGLPIVLGPEHPTTGGYPVLAVIASADLDRFFAIRLGGDVRFAI